MNEDDKTPKKAFNEKAPEPTIADKDNTNYKPKPPTFANSSSPRLAPTGNVPVTQKEQEFEIEFIPYDPAEHPINLGTDDLTLLWEDNGYTVKIKQEEQQHKEGIDSGRISRLALEKDGEASVYFDYGEWVKSPKTPLEIQMVDDIKADVNHAPDKDFKGFHDPDPDDDHEI